MATWDAALAAEGRRLVRERFAAGVAPGRCQILAAINAVQTAARDVRDTDWVDHAAAIPRRAIVVLR